MKALLIVGFALFSLLKLTESKQHLWLKPLQEAAREGTNVGSDKNSNKWLCLSRLFFRVREGIKWPVIIIETAVLSCINQSYSFWLLSDPWAETTLNQGHSQGEYIRPAFLLCKCSWPGLNIDGKFPWKSHLRSPSRNKRFYMEPVTLFLIFCIRWDHSCKQLFILISPWS